MTVVVITIKMKTTTTVANHGVPVLLLKLQSHDLAPLPYPVIASIVLTVKFHFFWKVSNILHHHRQYHNGIFQNCCPISVSLTVCQIFESFCLDYINSTSKDNLNPKQFGFQTKRVTLLQFPDYLETIYTQQTDVMFFCVL